MKRYQVWVRPLGTIATKFRVSGDDEANHLRESLQNRGVECTEPVPLSKRPLCTFRVLHGNRIDHDKLIEIVNELPEVELMIEPA